MNKSENQKTNTSDNLRKVSLVLFLIIGIMHIISGLMFSNGYFHDLSLRINRILDIPFAMTGIIYAFMSIYEKIGENHKKTIKLLLIIFSLLIFLLLLYINLFLPDKASFISN